jgi:hypothetical protein
MNKFDNDTAKINYNVIPFYFDWYWIRDKQIIHRGTDEYGMLTIVDEDGVPVKMFGYELMNNNEDEKQ